MSAPPDVRPAPVPTTAQPARRAGRAGIAAAALAVVAVTLVVGVVGLTRGNALGNDEAATFYAGHLSWSRLAHLLSHIDAVHGLYYALIHLWFDVAGRTPVRMRVPSVAAVALATGGLVLLGRQLTGSTPDSPGSRAVSGAGSRAGAGIGAGVGAGLVAAATTAVSYYAQTGRSYALVYLVIVAATLVLVSLLRRATPAGTGWWAGYAVLLALAGWLNEIALLALAAHACAVLAARRDRARFAAAAVVAVVIVSPLLWISGHETAAVDFLRPPGRTDVLQLVHAYLGATPPALLLVGALAVVGALPARWCGETPDGPTVRTVALPLAVLPAALLFAESWLATPLFTERYLLFGEIGTALLAGAGIVRVARVCTRGRPGVAGPTAAVLAVVLPALVLAAQLGPQRFVRQPASRSFNLTAPARVVAAGCRPGDAVLFSGVFFRTSEDAYPDLYRCAADVALAVTPQASGTFTGRAAAPAVVRARLLTHDRVWVVGRLPSGGSPKAAAVAGEVAVLRARYVVVRSQAFKGVTVTLWTRRR